MTEYTNIMTRYTIQWIRHNNYTHIFRGFENVDEMKKWIGSRLFPTNNIHTAFKKGAQYVKWNVVLEVVKAMCLLIFFTATISAKEIRVTYTVSTKHAGRSLVFSAQKQSKGETSAGVSKDKIQNISILGDSRGDTNDTTTSSEKKETRKIARINPSRIDIVESDIVPYKKYLTEQGENTRQTVMRIAEQVYSGQDLIAFDNLIKAESGYRYDALNEIGAGGLGQALPYTKMGCQLTEEDVPCQVIWMTNYIEQRYGTPSKAWNHWLSEVPINGKNVGHWY